MTFKTNVSNTLLTVKSMLNVKFSVDLFIFFSLFYIHCCTMSFVLRRDTRNIQKGKK